MRSRNLCAVLCVGMMMMVGCAKKKSGPPRGEVLGTVLFGLETEQELREQDINFDPAKHCLQRVKLTNGKEVVELSDNACPESGLADHVIATFKMFGKIDPSTNSTLLTMGDSEVRMENQPVATLSKSEDGLYEMNHLCAKYDHFEFKCQVNYSSTGSIASIATSDMDATDALVFQSIMKHLGNYDVVSAKIVAGKKAMTDLEGRIDGADGDEKALRPRIVQIEGLIKDIKREESLLNSDEAKANRLALREEIASLETRLSALTDRKARKSLATVKNTISSLEERIEKLNVPGVRKSLELLNADIAKTEQAIEDLSSDENKKAIASAQSSAEKAQGAINGLGSEASKKAIENAQSSAEKAQASINGLSSEENKKAIESAQGSAEKAQAAIKGLGSEANKKAIESAQSSADKAQSSINGLSSEENGKAIEGAKSKVEAAEAFINAKIAQIRKSAESIEAEVKKAEDKDQKEGTEKEQGDNRDK